MNGCLSRFMLERCMLGEVEATDPAALHLGSCETCRRALADLVRDTDSYRASEAAARVRTVLACANRGRENGRLLFSSAVVALAAALLLGVWFGQRQGFRPPGTTADRAAEQAFAMKGGALALFVQHGSSDPVPWDGAPVDQGDWLQVTWSADRNEYVAVAALRPSGNAIPIAPRDGEAALVVSPGRHVPVGESVRVGASDLVLVALSWDSPFVLAPLLPRLEWVGANGAEAGTAPVSMFEGDGGRHFAGRATRVRVPVKPAVSQ